MDTKELEKQVKENGGEYSDEIIEKVHKLAEVDLKMKSAMDEIEKLSVTDFHLHNALAGRVNELVTKACEEGAGDSDGAEDSSLKGKHERSVPNQPIKVEVHLVKAPPVPLGLMALMDFLLS